MSSELNQQVMTLTSGKNQGSPRRKIQVRGNIRHSTDPCNKMQEDVSVRKRRAGDDGEMPGKRRRWSTLTKPTEHTAVSVVNAWLRSGKRKADHDGETPKKRGRCSDTNASEHSEVSVEDPWVESRKRKASDDGEAPEKKIRCSNSTSISESSTSQPSITESSTTESCITESSTTESNTSESSITESSTSGSNITVSSLEVKDDVSADDDDISHNFGSVSAEEEKIYEMSSSGNTSRAEFEDKYCQLAAIGAGGFGSVYGGFRKSDFLPVAIKRIPSKDVRCERVMCNGKVFNIILEVALMLKTAGLPGPVGESAAVSLLDWYILDQDLILVMERSVLSKDLYSYLQAHRGSLDEDEAKMILRQLVDAAIDMHSKGVFHRDIKLQNVLVQLDSGVRRVRVIDFGCGTFSTEMSHTSFCGTRSYFPPEWFEYQTYWARLTTVWQLGALFYLLLSGHEHFTTTGFIHNNIQINRALSTEVKTLLHMCLARDPAERATLEELQLHLALKQPSPPPAQGHLHK